MNYHKLNGIKKPVFTVTDAAAAMGISYSSAKVTLCRYAGKGLVTRVKKNLYVFPGRWNGLTPAELFPVANLIEVPSYISFTTALAYYDISTQVQRDFFESASVKRTKEAVAEGNTFVYSKLSRKLYGGFVKKDGFFIAYPEKALLDSFYLFSLGRYNLDVDALDLSKIDSARAAGFLKLYPEKTAQMWRKYVGPVKTRKT